MRIPDYLNGPRPTPEPRRSSAEHESRMERAGNGAQSPGGVKGSKLTRHLAAPEILELTARLRELPDVRQKVIARVAKQLQSGNYLTREAAEWTAERLLGEAG